MRCVEEAGLNGAGFGAVVLRRIPGECDLAGLADLRLSIHIPHPNLRSRSALAHRHPLPAARSDGQRQTDLLSCEFTA